MRMAVSRYGAGEERWRGERVPMGRREGGRGGGRKHGGGGRVRLVWTAGCVQAASMDEVPSPDPCGTRDHERSSIPSPPLRSRSASAREPTVAEGSMAEETIAEEAAAAMVEVVEAVAAVVLVEEEEEGEEEEAEVVEVEAGMSTRPPMMIATLRREQGAEGEAEPS